jgi:2-oxoisovalerate dehydrogenase E1 component
MKFDITDINKSVLVDLYQKMLKSRMIEEKMITLLRQGKISKWFSGIGQEAISTGITSALNKDEFILPMHRNLSVFTSRDIPLKRLFAQWQGKEDGFTKGRDRSFHFGTIEYNIVGMISHLGPQMGVACGIALSEKLKKTGKVCAVFIGDGGTSQGDFHEALNLASVWKLPVIFAIENNGYGLSTPANEQYAIEDLADRGASYGIESHIVDGNNIIDVYRILSKVSKSIRNDPKPILLEFKTFRIKGHEEASGQEYIENSLIDQWAKKDPIKNYEKFLLKEKIISNDSIKKISQKIAKEIDTNWKKANSLPEVKFNQQKELSDVFKEYKAATIPNISNTSENIRFVDSIKNGIDEAMEEHDNLVIMGQDIAEYGGVFKITEGLMGKYGKNRVFNTPLCESSILSASYGMSIGGFKTIVEMQFSDFISSGFTSIVNLIAKSNYRWSQNSDIVVRMPCGGGVGAGPFHSQTNEVWFSKVPGLKIVYPAFPSDAKGLLHSSIDDPNPVLFFEHKNLYRTIREDVMKNRYTLELGKGKIRQVGDNLTVVTYGMGVHWILDLLKDYNKAQIEVIDLNSLVPWDKDLVFNSVKKTGKVLLLQEDSQFSGFMGEISSCISEEIFEYLDAPIVRVGSLDTPIPFAKDLEKGYMAQNRLKERLDFLLNY